MTHKIAFSVMLFISVIGNCIFSEESQAFDCSYKEPPFSTLQTKAQQFAIRLSQTAGNSAELMELFSKDADFCWAPGAMKSNYSEFSNLISQRTVPCQGSCKESFLPDDQDGRAVIFKVDGFQYREGLENTPNQPWYKGAGWYHVQQTMRLEFHNENEPLKISNWFSLDHNFQKAEESMQGLPAAFSLAKKLALTLFSEQENFDKIRKFYNENAKIKQADGSEVNLDELGELIKRENIGNIIAQKELHNSFVAVEGEPNTLEWTTEAIQLRRGLGQGENGEGWYKIRQVAKVLFDSSSPDAKVLNQRNLVSTKFKLHQS